MMMRMIDLNKITDASGRTLLYNALSQQNHIHQAAALMLNGARLSILEQCCVAEDSEIFDNMNQAVETIRLHQDIFMNPADNRLAKVLHAQLMPRLAEQGEEKCDQEVAGSTIYFIVKDYAIPKACQYPARWKNTRTIKGETMAFLPQHLARLACDYADDFDVAAQGSAVNRIAMRLHIEKWLYEELRPKLEELRAQNANPNNYAFWPVCNAVCDYALPEKRTLQEASSDNESYADDVAEPAANDDIARQKLTHIAVSFLGLIPRAAELTPGFPECQRLINDLNNKIFGNPAVQSSDPEDHCRQIDTLYDNAVVLL